MWIEILIISAITLVLGVFGTLAWWKLADAAVPDEHKRFKTKHHDATPSVVVKISEQDSKSEP
jgi:CHASE2 domain-containing sensor protein